MRLVVLGGTLAFNVDNFCELSFHPLGILLFWSVAAVDPPVDKNITWKCQVCEVKFLIFHCCYNHTFITQDVVQTYHDRYRCAGN